MRHAGLRHLKDSHTVRHAHLPLHSHVATPTLPPTHVQAQGGEGLGLQGTKAQKQSPS